jgi:hypothetical protein
MWQLVRDLKEIANYSFPNICEYYKSLLELFIEMNVGCNEAMCAGYKYSKSHSL